MGKEKVRTSQILNSLFWICAMPYKVNKWRGSLPIRETIDFIDDGSSPLAENYAPWTIRISDSQDRSVSEVYPWVQGDLTVNEMKVSVLTKRDEGHRGSITCVRGTAKRPPIMQLHSHRCPRLRETPTVWKVASWLVEIWRFSNATNGFRPLRSVIYSALWTLSLVV